MNNRGFIVLNGDATLSRFRIGRSLNKPAITRCFVAVRLRQLERWNNVGEIGNEEGKDWLRKLEKMEEERGGGI